MKRLISAKDIEGSILKEQKVIYLDGTEIITPSARELANASGIVMTTEKVDPIIKSEPINKTDVSNLDLESMLELFKTMMNKGLLQEMIGCLEKSKLPFTAETDKSGLKVVRGSSVQMEYFDTGNPDNKVYFQELVSKEESKMSAGFLHIEDSSFEWELTYEEIDYVIEGTLTVEINGHKYVAHPGDVLFVPSGSKVIWGSPDKARVFYATYPANWPDLL
jgi:ethanolamine utilization protein EutQ